ncbi:MAG: DUF4352 domain-containing protein [Candidatus Pacearchaeota archaeon]
MVKSGAKKSWYTRWWAIILFVFIGLTILGGLFGEDSSNTSIKDTNSIDENENIQANQEELKIYSVGDSVQAGDFKWKITQFTTSKTIGSNPYLTSEASGIYLILDVEVENTGNSAEYLMDSYLKLIDNQNREFSPDSGAAIYLDSNKALLFEQVNPGIVKKGKIVFDVPEGLEFVNVRISSNLLSSSVYQVKLMV